MRIRFIALLLVAISIMYVGYTQITAQDSSSCPSLIQSALNTVGNNCGGLDRNSACYGYDSVVASFIEQQPPDYFANPSDRAGLFDLQGISTAPLDPVLNQWGVALLSVQANLPETLPGQSVVFMVFGGTQVENAVAPEDAFQTGGTASVTLQIGADLYFEPSMGADVVGNVPMGVALTADAVSDDGQWVRVVYSGIPGWLTRQVINGDADLSTLAVIGPNTKTPMQAFYFRTGIAGTECSEAPTSLIVQGPQNLAVDINANGADIRLSSTIALTALDVDPMTLRYLQEQYGDIGAIGKLLKIVVIDGHVVLNAGTPEEVVLETGETTFRCLSEPDNLGLDGESNDREVIDTCPWAPERAVTVEELEEFRDIEGFPLNYVIELPLELPTLTPTPTNTARPPGVFLPTQAPTLTPTPLPTATTPPDNQPPPPQPTSVPPTAIPPTATPNCPVFTFPASAPDIPSLITAINYANDEVCFPGLNAITLGGQSYSFSAPDNNTNGPNALPVITSPIAIDGQGSGLSNTEVELRYFYVSGSGSLALYNLYIGSGWTSGFNGGSILNEGTLSLNGVTMSSGSAENGGLLYNTGTVSMSGTTLEFGYANNQGGNIYNGGSLTINKSAIINGSANGDGGGIYNVGTISMINSTLADNDAGGGGGLGLMNAGGSVVMNFVTVSGNAGDGGAQVFVAGGTVAAHNTIIANAIGGSNCSGAVGASGVNFDNDGSCSGFINSTFLNMGGLGFNGGNSQTIPLFFPSDAIDANGCTDNGGGTVGDDQRGVGRPYIAETPDAMNCDSGSFEYDGGQPLG